MRIGIDARTILNPEHGDAIGSGHYTYQIIRHLLEIDQENEYVLFFDFRVREKDIRKFTRKNTRVRFYPFSDYKKYLPGAYSEILGRATLVRERLDILHSTSPLSRIPSGYRGKCITTIHNLGVFSYPELYSPLRRAKERAKIKFAIGKSDRIIASSQSIANDLVRLFGVSEERVSIIPAGIDKRFFDPPATDGSKFRAKHTIEKPYILFLGTLSPINNIVRLIEAFAEFKKTEIGKPYQLVLAGKRDWLSKMYRQTAKDFKVNADVRFTGYVVGDDLVPLFRNAEFAVMPSLYEGFGSTVLEALATGTPIIAADIPALREIADDFVRFTDPLDASAMAQSLEMFARDEALRKTFAEKGIERARRYGWSETARGTLALYRDVVKNH
jgi:glycosyltransferase involved in cell wall biosynthesis